MTGRLIIQVAPVEQLAEAVARLRLHQPLILGLPPGGLLTASRVAQALQAPLDMLLPRHAGQSMHVAPAIAWPALAGRSAVIVDDGHADPLDWHAALVSLRLLQPDCVAIVVPAVNEAIERALANEYEHLFGRAAAEAPAALPAWDAAGADARGRAPARARAGLRARPRAALPLTPRRGTSAA